MISFIVIGQNEGWKLSMCFDSILDAVEKNHVKDFEIVYVDSQSTDNSLNIAQRYDKIRIFSIEGKCSAAIARNIGGKEALDGVLVFLDGDMTLNATFLRKAMNENEELIYPFLTGMYTHRYYDSNRVVVKSEVLEVINDNVFVKVTGGFFMMTKKMWQEVEGMDNRLDRNEDIDLGLRLCKINRPPLKLAEICINHYTGMDKSMVHWVNLACHYRFSSVLARKHLLNRHYLPMCIRMNYTSIFLFVTLILSLAGSSFFLLYVLLILIRAFANRNNRNSKMILYYCLRDIVFVLCFFTYYPGRPEIVYKACSADGTSI